jgi:hypothetical protein
MGLIESSKVWEFAFVKISRVLVQNAVTTAIRLFIFLLSGLGLRFLAFSRGQDIEVDSPGRVKFPPSPI